MKRIWIFSFSFRIIAILLVLALFCAYLSPFINPKYLSIISIFGLYFIPILCLNLIWLFIAAKRRSRSFWIPLIAILPSFFFITRFINFSDNEGKEEGDIRLYTYNVGRFQSARKGMDRTLCLQEINRNISSEDPDIVCLQEFEIRDTNYIDVLYQKYPYRKFHFFKFRNHLYYGNLTLSRFPILNSGYISFPKSTNIAIFSDIKAAGEILRVYNCHLESYNISLTRFIRSAFQNNKDTTNEFIVVHDRMRNTTQRRSAQVNQLLKHIEGSSLPSIFCGDFNDTPLSYSYHALNRKHKDSFTEAGNGFSATYRKFWPLLRIDYILVPQETEVSGHRTLTRLKLSDHYPVISEFSIKRRNNVLTNQL